MARELSLAEIFQLGYYWETKILLTAVKLDVFSAIGHNRISAAELADQLHLAESALTLLLNALVAMRVLKKEEERFSNSQVAQKHLVTSSPEYVGHLLVLHDAEWDNWGKLEETIRTGRSPVKRHVFETAPALGAQVLSVLDRIGRESGPSFAKRLNLNGATRFLDLGGGAGTNAIAFCQVYPKLKATVFDLATTLEAVTHKTVQDSNCAERIRLVPGNFNTDSLDGPYDVVLMSDILHYQDAATNAALVRKVYDHLEAGGRLIMKDRFLDRSLTSPAWTTAFAVHILVNTERGRCFTSDEAMQWMEEAGFESVTELEPRAVIVGIRPVASVRTAHG